MQCWLVFLCQKETMCDALIDEIQFCIPSIVLGATNRPQDVDKDILRRLPATFYIRLPVTRIQCKKTRSIILTNFIGFSGCRPTLLSCFDYSQTPTSLSRC